MLGIETLGWGHSDHCPNEHCEPCCGDNGALEGENIAELLGGDEHEGELDDPVDEVTHDA